MSKRLNFKDNFEMLYLRHEYLKKAKKLDSSMVERYAGIVATTSKIMFNRLTNFEKVGFAEEDIVSIANVYMLSYMALYSIQNNPKQLESVLRKRKVESLPHEEILRIDRNRLISFLRQRLHHCGTLCARKARNITVGKDRRGIFAETSVSQSVSRELILNDYKKYGYRKITIKEYKEAITRAKNTRAQDLTDLNGFKIIKIEILNDGISKEDYHMLMESNASFMSQPPDTIMEKTESDRFFDQKRKYFNDLKKKQRDRVLSSFIRKNKGNKNLTKEIGLAKKMLKEEKAMV